MSEPKFCKDCKHYEARGWDTPVCTARAKYDLLTGEPIYQRARMARAYGMFCGDEGAAFVPKPPPRWWEFWK